MNPGVQQRLVEGFQTFSSISCQFVSRIALACILTKLKPVFGPVF